MLSAISVTCMYDCRVRAMRLAPNRGVAADGLYQTRTPFRLEATMSELPGSAPPTAVTTAIDCLAPDLIEAVVGFRQWHLDGDRLYSPQRNVVWDDAVIHARRQSCVHDPDQIPAHDCACGIYAYYEQVPRSVSARRNLVAGAVVLWGDGGAAFRWDAVLTRSDRRADAAAHAPSETTRADRCGSVARRAGRAVLEIESRRRPQRVSSAKDAGPPRMPLPWERRTMDSR